MQISQPNLQLDWRHRRIALCMVVVCACSIGCSAARRVVSTASGGDDNRQPYAAFADESVSSQSDVSSADGSGSSRNALPANQFPLEFLDGGQPSGSLDSEPVVGAASPLSEARLNDNLPASNLADPKSGSLVAPPDLPAAAELEPQISSPQEAIAFVESLNGSVRRDDQQKVVAIDLSFSKIRDSQLSCLEYFDSLKQLDLTGSGVTDVGIVLVCQNRTLQSVKLKGTVVSDQGLALLSQLPDLQLLDASRTLVSDRGMNVLTQSGSLKFLALNSTAVSDHSVVFLSRMKNLKGVSLVDTSITADGIRQLRFALPDCVVVDGAAASRLPEAIQMQMALGSATFDSNDFKTSGVGRMAVSGGLTSVSAYSRDANGQPDQLQLMVQLAARRPALAVSLADVYVRNNQWDEAALILQSAVNTDPANQDLQFRLGEALAFSGRPRDAERFLRSAAGEAAANYSMGLIAYEAMLKQCEQYFERAVASDPGMQSARDRLTEIRNEIQDIHTSRSPAHSLARSPQIVPGAAPMKPVSRMLMNAGQYSTQQDSRPIPSQPASMTSAVLSGSQVVPGYSPAPRIEIVPERKAAAPVRLGGAVSIGAWRRAGP